MEQAVFIDQATVILIVLVVALLIWNLGLTFVIWKERSFLRELFPKSSERDIRKKFEEILESVGGFNQKLNGLNTKLSELEKDGFGHVQKVRLLRYNPYNDVGGDQSFSVALLDKKGTGVVVTSLHTRSGTRVFAKQVIVGKANKYEFSKEEEQVVKEALNYERSI